jgi:hypothetical protein
VLRKAFFLDQEHIDFLENLPGTASEHVRRAIDDYKAKRINVSASESKGKEGK